MIFNNANYRAFPPNSQLNPISNYSQVIAYKIMEEKGTYDVDFAYVHKEKLFSGVMSGALRVPFTVDNNVANIYTVFGCVIQDEKGRNSSNHLEDACHVRFLEFLHRSQSGESQPADSLNQEMETVFEMKVGGLGQPFVGFRPEWVEEDFFESYVLSDTDSL